MENTPHYYYKIAKVWLADEASKEYAIKRIDKKMDEYTNRFIGQFYRRVFACSSYVHSKIHWNFENG